MFSGDIVAAGGDGNKNNSNTKKDNGSTERSIKSTVFAAMQGTEASSAGVPNATASGSKEEGGKHHSGSMDWPEEKKEMPFLTQTYQRLTYSYMDPLLVKGSRQKFQDGTRLSQDDLFRVPSTLESSFLTQKFEDTYQEEKKKGTRGVLLRTLYRMAAPSFNPAGFCELVTVLCQVALPLLVRELLRLLEENPAQAILDKALPYVVSMFAVLVLNAAANHRHRYLATQSGIVLRGTIVGIVYKRVLQLSPAGRLGLTSGEVTNIVAIDTQKLFEVTQEAHLIWAMPLSIILVTICLVIVMGPVTLIGVLVLLMMVPLVERVASAMLAIRLERVQLTDKRVEITNAMIQGIKVTKLNNYEENYKSRVKQARKSEIQKLRKELFVWAFSLVLTVISPTLASAATFVVYVLVDNNHILTASETFTVLLLFNALRFPINYFGRLLGRSAQALASIERIAHFLNREVRREEELQIDKETVGSDRDGTTQQSPLLTVANASFQIGLSDSIIKDAASERSSKAFHDADGFEVSDINFELRKGEILAVCGAVGSGKSTIVNGIIEEVAVAPGAAISLRGKTAYVSQTAFIMNSTLRENILFGEHFEEERYEKVLEACCLWPDIELLGEAGDLTEIGERGVTLSGGQKQRVTLARAAYSQPAICLLDDPLSALDAGTSKIIFENLRSLLSGSAIVLVTHAAHFLSRVDKILVVSEGRVRFTGTWTELLDFVPADGKTHDAVEHIRSSVQEGSSDRSQSNEASNEIDGVDVRKGKAATLGEKGKLMTVEEREHGLSSLSTWLLWFQRAGGIMFIFAHVFFMTIDRLSYVAVEYWLARWTEGAYKAIDVFGLEFAPQSDGPSAQANYLIVYGLVILASIVTTVLRSEWVVTGGSRAARRVFLSMLSRVLFAPMVYFETTPIGRVLNRFTYDMEVVDITLTEAMSVLMIACGWFVTAIVVMCTIIPWMALAIFPITLVYWLLLLHYRKSGADLQRLDAVARSPIQAMLAEALEGNATIRVFGQRKKFIDKFATITDSSGTALLNFISAQRWLGIRIELLGSVIVLSGTVLVVTLNDVMELEPGIVALLILWSSNFTITLGFMVDSFSEAEAAITAIERVDAMSRLPQEKPMESDAQICPPKNWPEHGCLEFDNVCMRYREGLPLSLNGLSFKIPAGKRCGIVGRTGAGKSSLTAALFRLVEIESGHIYLDGRDLGELGLADVRGRANGMAIIPQDPFLAGTTLRECLDPFNSSEDKEILSALVDVRLAPSHDSFDVLDAKLEEGGSNFSVGERQLLNLARAILMKPRLLCLDEATASIDGETDAFVQRMLRTKFRDTTLITVAHRLQTIMDYDLVLVMDAGRAAEIGSPMELLSLNGLFAELVKATGVESANALREMAQAAEHSRS